MQMKQTIESAANNYAYSDIAADMNEKFSLGEYLAVNKLGFVNGATWALTSHPAVVQMHEVMERALALSQNHEDFKLYAMEPFHKAILEYLEAVKNESFK